MFTSMFPTTVVSFLFASTLVFVSVDQSSCRQHLSRQESISHSHFRSNRPARRSLSQPTHSPPRRRSLSEDESFPPASIPSIEDVEFANARRSINFDEIDDDDLFDDSDNLSSAQVKDQAQRLWDEFVSASPGEDPNYYPDCDDEEEDPEIPSGSSASTNSSKKIPSISTASPSNKGGNGESKPDDHNPKTQGANSAGSAKPVTPVLGPSENLDDPHSHKEKEGDKDKEAEEQKKEAERQKKEAEQQKQQEAAEAKKKEEAAAAAAAAAAQKAQEEEDKKKKAAEAAAAAAAAQAKKGAKPDPQDSYQVTDVQKIPGSSATTGDAQHSNDNKPADPPTAEHKEGDATFYEPGLGACGRTNNSGDYIVAVSRLLYDSFPAQDGNPNTSTVCGKKIRATYQGKSVEVEVVDRCEDCSKYSLDFTLTAFSKIGKEEEGRLHGMTWQFIS